MRLYNYSHYSIPTLLYLARLVGFSSFDLAKRDFWLTNTIPFLSVRKYPPTHYPDGTPDPGIFPLVMIALFTLLALHIFWSAIIVSMVIKALRDGLIKGDLRDPHFDEVAIEEVEHSAT